MLRLYDYSDSGNGYKARLALAQLAIPHRVIEVDIDKGETRTPEFLAMNPNGRIPLLALDNGVYLAESNAILCYLAEGSALMPKDALDRAAANSATSRRSARDCIARRTATAAPGRG
jgi:glutathione S-transferase